MAIIENLRQKWRKNRQQARLRIIQQDLECAQKECALLGATIGRLVRRKSELEIQIAREES